MTGDGPCLITYRNPRTGETTTIEVERRLYVGRAPKQPGLVITDDDPFVSATAIEVRRSPEGVQIGNVSSHSHLEIRTDQGLRVLFRGEYLLVPGDASVMLQSSPYQYRIEVSPGAAVARQRPRSGTRRLHEEITIAAERKPVLAALCAAHFLPERYGTSPLKASQIAEVLSTRGRRLTAKAVNNKIQRTREQIEELTGQYVDDREGLIAYLVRHGHVTLADVREHLGLGD
jgi:hypothetical protein